MEKYVEHFCLDTIYKATYFLYNISISNSRKYLPIFQTKQPMIGEDILKKVVFLCVDPWERFLSPAVQSYGREYFCRVQTTGTVQEEQSYCAEHKEIYGEEPLKSLQEFFLLEDHRMQIVYVQSKSRHILEDVFQKADLVVMGLPGSKKEFEKIYLEIFPWIDQVLFLWDERVGKGDVYLKELCHEFKLDERQFWEMKNGHGFLEKMA